MPFVHSLAHPGRRSLSLVGLLTTLALLTLAVAADARPKRGPNAVSDTTAPETTISSGPSGTITVATARFAFESSEGGSNFECRLDSAAYAPCSSPKAYSALADGAHSLSVRATDAASNTDVSPATRSFAVDTTASTLPPPSGAIPSSWRRFASFESTLDADGDFGWRVDSPFSGTRTDEVAGSDGSYAAKIVTNGGNSGCSCPRMTFEDGFSYGPGDEVWFGGSWYVTDTSKLAWSRLMNLGHWASGDPSSWHLQFESTDSGSFQVGYAPYGGPKTRLVSVSIPQGHWFSVDVHVKLSRYDGQALTEVYLDSRLIGSTTKANMYSGGGPLNFYNGGLPYFWPGNGSTTVYFDAPRIAD